MVFNVSRLSSTHVLLRPAWVKPTNKEQLHSATTNNASHAVSLQRTHSTSFSSIAADQTSARELVRVEIRVFCLVFCNYGLKCIAQPSWPRRASRKARDLFRAGNRNCAWAYRQASRCDRVDFQGTRVGDACCQSCKAAKVNDLLSQDPEFVLG